MGIHKILKLLNIDWINTLYFNFHYLPFQQAIRLPVFLYRAKLLSCKGQVIISNSKIKTGMIQLGTHSVSLYPNSGIVWENFGGKVIFKGCCNIGNASAISVGKSGNIEFGNNFIATTTFKIVSYHLIKISENVLVAWDTIWMDTSFHGFKDINGDKVANAYNTISIGSNNWIPTKCMVLNCTKTPNYCVFGVGSILFNDYSSNSTYSFMAGHPLTVKLIGVWHDFNDDIIMYNSILQ